MHNAASAPTAMDALKLGAQGCLTRLDLGRHLGLTSTEAARMAKGVGVLPQRASVREAFRMLQISAAVGGSYYSGPRSPEYGPFVRRFK